MNLTPEEKRELLCIFYDMAENVYLPHISHLPPGLQEDAKNKIRKIRTIIESCPEPRTDEERREFVEKWTQSLRIFNTEENRINLNGMLTDYDKP